MPHMPIFTPFGHIMKISERRIRPIYIYTCIQTACCPRFSPIQITAESKPQEIHWKLSISPDNSFKQITGWIPLLRSIFKNKKELSASKLCLFFTDTVYLELFVCYFWVYHVRFKIKYKMFLHWSYYFVVFFVFNLAKKHHVHHLPRHIHIEQIPCHILPLF